MTKATVELDWDTVDNIVVEQLKFHRNIIEEDLVKRKNGKTMARFDTNKRKDIAMMKEHIEAFNLILSYYGQEQE